MEQLNKIEIRGIVGSVYVKDFVNAKVANISVATNHGYTSRDGSAVIETTWHYVTAWVGKDIQNLKQLKKGSGINVIGRLRNRKYVATDGTERIAYEFVVEIPTRSDPSKGVNLQRILQCLPVAWQLHRYETF